MLSVAIITDEGKLKIVLSGAGAVVGQNSVSLPHDTTRKDLAIALRMLADWVGEYK